MKMLMLIALVLRLIFLNQSLWLDEAIEAIALQGKLGPLLQYALADFQPPLYHFLLALWTKLAGFSEIALRLPSVLAGVGTAYFVFKIGEYLGGLKLARLAALLVATNPLLIYYSQEGRTYALTAFLVTASFYYYLQLLQNRTVKHTIGYFVFTTLFLWTSYLAWFVALAQGIYIVISRRPQMLIPLGLAASTLLLWAPFFWRSLAFGLGDAALTPQWAKVVGGISLKALALTWIKLTIGRIAFTPPALYAGIVGLIAVVHAYILKSVSHRQYPVLLTWLLIPVILSSLASVFIPVYSYTRVLFIVPAYLLFLAIGLTRFKSNLLTILVVVVQLSALGYFWVTPRFHREDWRALTAHLNEQKGSSVALPSLKVSAPLIYYGLSRPTLELPTGKIEPGQSAIYYVRYAEAIFDPSLLGQARLDASGYTKASQQTYTGIQLDVYEDRH